MIYAVLSKFVNISSFCASAVDTVRNTVVVVENNIVRYFPVLFRLGF